MSNAIIMEVKGEAKSINEDGKAYKLDASTVVANRKGEAFFKTDNTFNALMYFGLTKDPQQVRNNEKSKHNFDYIELKPAQGDRFRIVHIAIGIEKQVYLGTDGTPKAISKQVIEYVFNHKMQSLLEANMNVDAKMYKNVENRLKEVFEKKTNPDEWLQIRGLSQPTEDTPQMINQAQPQVINQAQPQMINQAQPQMINQAQPQMINQAQQMPPAPTPDDEIPF
jgi:hypothetical protein